jgi:hypothetical protein
VAGLTAVPIVTDTAARRGRGALATLGRRSAEEKQSAIHSLTLSLTICSYSPHSLTYSLFALPPFTFPAASCPCAGSRTS